MQEILRAIRVGFLNAIIFVGVLIAVSLVFGALGISFFDQPPVSVQSVESSHLGSFCPGDKLLIRNKVTIDKPVIALYYISVLDKDAIFNIVDTQIVHSGFQHPVAGTFDQYIPWQIPELESGVYTRGFAARGTDGTEETVFITNTFTIPTTCKKGTADAKSSPDYRIDQNASANSDSLGSTNGFLAADE